jgi:hypothetical protein
MAVLLGLLGDHNIGDPPSVHRDNQKGGLSTSGDFTAMNHAESDKATPMSGMKGGRTLSH